MSSDPFGQPPLFGGDDVFDIDIPVDAGKPSWFVEPGEYVARLVDIERGTSRNSNPQIIWTYAIEKAADSANNGMVGKEIKDFTTMTSAAMWRVTQTLDALGIPYTPGQPLQMSRSTTLGKKVILVIEEREFGGRPQSSISRVLAFDGSSASTSDMPA